MFCVIHKPLYILVSNINYFEDLLCPFNDNLYYYFEKQIVVAGPGLPSEDGGVCSNNVSRPVLNHAGLVGSPPYNQMKTGRTERSK